MNASPPEQELVERTICELNRALRSHGGGVEQVGDVQDGVLRLRMTGLCAGSLYRPLTTIGTLKPFIAERLGIDVEVAGARISDEAQRRVLAALSRSYEGPGS